MTLLKLRRFLDYRLLNQTILKAEVMLPRLIYNRLCLVLINRVPLKLGRRPRFRGVVRRLPVVKDETSPPRGLAPPNPTKYRFSSRFYLWSPIQEPTQWPIQHAARHRSRTAHRPCQ